MFRDYQNSPDRVSSVYKLNHEYQTVDYVKEQINKYCIKFDRAKMTIWDAIEELNKIVDESDPDLDKPQIIHAFQTAEGLRRRFPKDDWMPLVGLIHDLGKIIALPQYGEQPQWSTVGDIFPVGCEFSDKIVFHKFFEANPDFGKYDKFGMYQPNCGLDKLLMSFGHDYYMYCVLKHNGCLIPEMGLKIIRYHSFYAWHKEGAYERFMEPNEFVLRDTVREFSNCDLYTKDNNSEPDIPRLKQYYQGLIEKYFPNPVLEW